MTSLLILYSLVYPVTLLKSAYLQLLEMRFLKSVSASLEAAAMRFLRSVPAIDYGNMF